MKPILKCKYDPLLFTKLKWHRMIYLTYLIAGCISLFGCASDPVMNSTTKEVQLQVPPGFTVEVYADQVKDARAMCIGDKGTLFVGSRGNGKVYALLDHDNDYKADEIIVIDEGLNMPVGVAFNDGDLYVSAVNKIIRYDDIENNLNNPPAPVIVSESFPDEDHHGWKFIDFGPDGKLYVPVGAPCNICNEDPNIYATIMRMDKDGSNLEVFARGIRNTVGFAWHPVTGELWFTDNGRDWMGDDQPACELNYAPKKGMHFGYPFCHGGDVADPEFGKERDCAEFTPPKWKFDAHTAPLGMCFYTGTMFPEQYRNTALVALHGSWNRSTKIGYEVVLVNLSKDNAVVKVTPFLKGFLQSGKVSGRPVDILQLADGSVLVSDDHGDQILRITYAN